MSRTAIVTGATKGIGKAIAYRLLQEGWMVVITYSSDTQAATITYDEFLEIAPGRVYLLQADISDLSSIETIDGFLGENAGVVALVVHIANGRPVVRRAEQRGQEGEEGEEGETAKP